MRHEEKTKEQLIKELEEMRQRVEELEATKAKPKRTEISIMDFIVKQFVLLEPHLKKLCDDYKNQMLRKKLKNCGQNCYLHGAITVAYPERLSIGNNVHINDNAFINARGGVIIGDNTHISRNLTLYSYSHNYKGKALPYDDTAIKKPVVIGRNVWIAMDVKIVPGVTIGDGAIIGLGTVVSKDIPSLAIVGNQPPRIIKYRDEAHYKDLEKSGYYGGVNGVPIINRQSKGPLCCV